MDTIHHYKRQLKQKYLIKKLFKGIVKELNLIELPIKFRISNNKHSTSYCQYFKEFGFMKLASKCIISLNLINETRIIKNGYTDYYYNGRNQKLSFVKNNRHLHKRFVILHELKHAIDRLTIGNTSEFNADEYAINNLIKITKKANILNKKHIEDWSCD